LKGNKNFIATRRARPDTTPSAKVNADSDGPFDADINRTSRAQLWHALGTVSPVFYFSLGAFAKRRLFFSFFFFLFSFSFL
jgi:hypothetical protein